MIRYADVHGDLLPINNDDNFFKAVSSAHPLLRVFVQRQGHASAPLKQVWESEGPPAGKGRDSAREQWPLMTSRKCRKKCRRPHQQHRLKSQGIDCHHLKATSLEMFFIHV